MRRFFTPLNVLYWLVFCVIANCYLLVRDRLAWLYLLVPVFLWLVIFAGAFFRKKTALRYRICNHGGVLLGVFYCSLLVSLAYHAVLAFLTLPDDYMTLVWSAVTCVCVSAAVFWVGIICVYCTSYQMGVGLRVVGALCGLIPIANLIVLRRIIITVTDEIALETEKERINEARREEEVCRTKYPILFVHGVFFRDTKYFNYWGRIPRELEKNGATVFYGEHQSALSVADSAKELAARIESIVAETGCEKVNIIAHSKGGLDCRYALSELGIAPRVASLTTVNTPHRGCVFADRLLAFAPDGLKDKVSNAYNTALRKLGDTNPDFMAAVSDLTHTACAQFNEDWRMPEGILCQSLGSRLNRARSGRFPLNLSYHLVKSFDGANDGLVGEDSFAWGEKYTLYTTKGKRGISHSDMIDLGRENIPDFDVREIYVGLVSDLKKRGL